MTDFRPLLFVFRRVQMADSLQHLSVNSIQELDTWSAHLQHISSAPLEYCEDFPTIARRYEAWWSCDLLDRPVLIASADKNPSRPIQRRLELLDQPEAWLEVKLADMLQLYRVGDKLPTLRVDLGPVTLGALLGAEVELVADTTWQHSFIKDDWSNAPREAWTIVNERWWSWMQARLAQAAEYAAGRCIITAPALGGSADVLLNLRGAAQLALDVLEQPERITDALDKIYSAWRQAWTESYRRARCKSSAPRNKSCRCAMSCVQKASLSGWKRRCHQTSWIICSNNSVQGTRERGD